MPRTQFHSDDVIESIDSLVKNLPIFLTEDRIKHDMVRNKTGYGANPIASRGTRDLLERQLSNGSGILARGYKQYEKEHNDRLVLPSSDYLANKLKQVKKDNPDTPLIDILNVMSKEEAFYCLPHRGWPRTSIVIVSADCNIAMVDVMLEQHNERSLGYQLKTIDQTKRAAPDICQPILASTRQKLLPPLSE